MKKKIEKFEDMIAWQKARELTSATYKLTNSGAFSRDYSLKDQVRRAAVSIMSNLAAGYERGGLPEFHRFLTIAKGSCAELRTQFYVALDVGYLSQTAFDSLMTQSVEVAESSVALEHQ